MKIPPFVFYGTPQWFCIEILKYAWPADSEAVELGRASQAAAYSIQTRKTHTLATDHGNDGGRRTSTHYKT